MTEQEQKKINIIKQVLNNQITRKEAMFELKKSRQQLYRLICIYKQDGETGLIHKNRGRTSEKKLDQIMLEEIKHLYLNEYYDFNFVAFYDGIIENEKYKDKYKISYSSLYNAFLNDDIISPIAHKGTIKLYNEKMNKAINDKKRD